MPKKTFNFSPKMVKQAKKDFFLTEFILLAKNGRIFTSTSPFLYLSISLQITLTNMVLVTFLKSLLVPAFLINFVWLLFVKCLLVRNIVHYVDYHSYERAVKHFLKYKYFYIFDIYTWPRLIQANFKWYMIVKYGRSSNVKSLKAVELKDKYLFYVTNTTMFPIISITNKVTLDMEALRDIKIKDSFSSSEAFKVLYKDAGELCDVLSVYIYRLVRRQISYYDIYADVKSNISNIILALKDVEIWSATNKGLSSRTTAKELIKQYSFSLDTKVEELIKEQIIIVEIISAISSKQKVITEIKNNLLKIES